MEGRTSLVAAVVLAASSLAGTLAAQEVDAQRRPPSLRDRLEQFRQDLLGNEAKPGAPQASLAPSGNRPANVGADRKQSGQTGTGASGTANSTLRDPGDRLVPQPSNPQRMQSQLQAQPQLQSQTSQNLTQPSPGLSQPQAQIKSTAAPAQPGTIARPNLESQALRRAQSGASPGTVREPEESLTAETPILTRRPTLKQSPTAASNEPAEADEADGEPTPVKSAAPLSVAKKSASVELEEIATPKTSRLNNAVGSLFTSQSPVISVETTGPRKVLIGKEAEFVIRVRNAGAAANNVVVTINIPTEAEVAAATASSGSAQVTGPGQRREPMEWKISRLEAKTSETLNLKIVPRKSSPLDLAVQWTFTPDTSQTLIEVQEPKLAMSVSGPEEVLYGQSKLYKLTVSNPGNGDTENVVLALLPVGRASEGIASHRIGTLRPGEARSVDIELTARQAGALSIKAQAYADGGLRSEAAQQVLVRRANLQIDVESPRVKYAGTVGTYRIKLINSGNAPAENVQVSALLPPEAKFVSASAGGRLENQQGKVNWSAGSLMPGVERVFEMQCSLSTPGENRLQIISQGEGDLSASTTSTTRVEALADLKLEVRDPQGPIPVGETASYEVSVRNRGTKAASDVELTIFFSDGLEATSVEGGGHEIGPGQVVFRPIANVPAGETLVFRVHTRADRSGNHVFRAELVCQTLDTKLAAEEATRFYGDDHARAFTARSRPENQQFDPPPRPLTPLGSIDE